MFDATLMTPSAPDAMRGRVWSSSPLKTVNPSGASRFMSMIWATFPEASFIDVMFLTAESFREVSAVMFTPVLDGTLYMII